MHSRNREPTCLGITVQARWRFRGESYFGFSVAGTGVTAGAGGGGIEILGTPKVGRVGARDGKGEASGVTTGPGASTFMEGAAGDRSWM